jgi:hypothetical protein
VRELLREDHLDERPMALAEQGVVEFRAAVHPDRVASVALLQRLGSVRLPAPDRALGSCDPGDLVFLRR